MALVMVIHHLFACPGRTNWSSYLTMYKCTVYICSGNDGAKSLLEIKYFVDRFHVKGHTTPGCDITSDKCQYHPDLTVFEELIGVNTESAEQCFSWLGKFKHSVKYMSQYRYKMFLYFVVTSRNSLIKMKLGEN